MILRSSLCISKSVSKLSFQFQQLGLRQSITSIFYARRQYRQQRSHLAPFSRQYRSSTPCLGDHQQLTLRQASITDSSSPKVRARALSDDPAPLPPGYTFYPYHSDKPNTPPTMAHIISSPHPHPSLPRSSVFDYLFPPPNVKEYYPKPDPKSVAFIDGLSGEEVTRGEVEEQALKLASGLKGLGVKRGDVGMTFGFNSLFYINAIMGIQAAGAVVSPANAA